ncbi:serine/threonine-protein kinase [Sorangium cellulosum]|uniref:serine/threonine-protein kinase n=1 Tax=Sorangium cellulosum TaxID=56 RepID=UPI00133171AE|nr:serine/threonine-protein kinase [Sorangium cellulosum]
MQATGVATPRIGGYRVRRLVARGGFGLVFEAGRERDGARVAIKVAREDRNGAPAYLEHEIAALARVVGPHVPAVHEHGRTAGGAPYLVMEYIDAPPLADRLVDRPEPVPVSEAVALADAILRALAAVHARGCLHRDLKPENILVDRTLHVTLIDFGLTIPLRSEDASAEVTAEGAGVGTAEYMAPELWEGALDLDRRADLYAVGAILFEMLAGSPPFWGPRPVVREGHMSRRPPRIGAPSREPSVLSAVEEVVSRCLAKERRERFDTADELRAALDAALREAPTLRCTRPGPPAAAPGAPAAAPETPAAAPGAPAAAPGPPAAAPAGDPRGDRVTVGLLFFDTTLDMAALQARLKALGGQLGRASAGRCAAVFAYDVSENPARHARRAAEELLRLGVCERARVDLAPVLVQIKRDGTRRFLSPLFSRAERFPAAGDPVGVAIAPAAAAVLHDLPDTARSGARSSSSGPLSLPSGAPSASRHDAPAPMAPSLPSSAPSLSSDALSLSSGPLSLSSDALSLSSGPLSLSSDALSLSSGPLSLSSDALSLSSGPLSLSSDAPALSSDAASAARHDVPDALDPDTWPLFGRDVVLAALAESALAAAAEGVPTVVSVIAEPGLGKSHLARALLARLAAAVPGARVLALRALEPALGHADQALAELLERVLDLPPGPPRDGGAALLRERLAPTSGDLMPAVALTLGWVTPGAEGAPLRAALRRLDAAPGALRTALTVAAGGAVRRAAARTPLLVVVDDAHFAGDALLAALEYAALAGPRLSLWICALGRPELEQERRTWGDGAARRERHRLGPLDAASADALCRRLLLPVESPPESAVQQLVARAEAIPLLLVELLRGLRREGIVRKSPKGEAWYLATDELDRLPDLPLIEWLARRELDALAPALRSHARLIALLGDQVTLDEIKGLLGLLEREGADAEFPLDARVGTARLLAARVVVDHGAGRVGYRHALVRESVARAVPEAQRRRIHRAAAAYYAQGRPGLGEERRIAQLARHAGAAGLADLAAHSFFALAERARARHAYTDAERLYSRVLEQSAGEAGEAGEVSVDRRATYRGRGLMRYRIGRYHDALTDLSCARELAAQAGDVAERVELLLDEATALDWMDDFEASQARVEEARVEEARALPPNARSPLLEARLLLACGRSAFRFSRNDEAAALLERSAAIAEHLGDDGYETLVIALTLLGFLLAGIGRPDDARAALDRAVDLAESRGDQLQLGAALNVRALSAANCGDEDCLIADMERSLAVARELGQRSLELMGEYNLGEYLLLLDNAPAAEPHVLRALALDRAISGEPGRAVVALLEARLRFHRGEEEAARDAVAHIRALQAEARARGEAGALLSPSEDVLCSALELATAAAAEDAAWEVLEARAARFSLGQERIEVVEARSVSAARRGRREEALRQIDRALELSCRVPSAILRRLARRRADLEKGDHYVSLVYPEHERR